MFDFLKAGVVDVSIHPSGKMALSVGKDNKLVTWNLVRKNHLPSKCISIRGERYNVVKVKFPAKIASPFSFLGAPSVKSGFQIKGRSAYVTNLHESAEFVRWSPDGAHYAVGLGRRVDVYSVATASVVAKVD